MAPALFSWSWGRTATLGESLGYECCNPELCCPLLTPCSLQVACLKKYMLVSLLQSGAVPALPKHTAPLVT